MLTGENQFSARGGEQFPMSKFLNPVIQVSRAWLPAVILVAGVCGCANNPGDTRDLKKYSGPEHVRSVDETRNTNRLETSMVPVKKIHNIGYVSLSEVARAANYHGVWLRDGSYGIGEHDPDSGNSVRVRA